MPPHPPESTREFSNQKPTPTDPDRLTTQENLNWSRDLVEHSRDLMCVHDLQGRLLWVNPLPARLLGYSVEEILQVPLRTLIDPKFRNQFEVYLRDIERGGEANGVMCVLTRAGER